MAGALAGVVELQGGSYGEAAASGSPLSRFFPLGDSGGSRVGQIATWLGRAIIEGQLPPGADLNSVDLAAHFRTSRTPVREALLWLEKEGLVEVRARRRPRVALTTIAEVREIYQIRAVLYGLVAELVAMSATTTMLAVLGGHLECMGDATRRSDVDGFFWANFQFHEYSEDICGNAHLKRLLHSLGLRTQQLRRLSMAQPGRMQDSYADHERMLRAYHEQDAPLAAALSRSSVLGALAAIERSLESAANSSNGQTPPSLRPLRAGSAEAGRPPDRRPVRSSRRSPAEGVARRESGRSAWT